MAEKLISLEDAAKRLGVSPDALGEMRQRQEIYGVRDGGTWKFKPEDVERARQDRSQQGILGPDASKSGTELTIDLPMSHSGIDMPIDLGDSKQDVVLSELELGDSGPGSSTVIGSNKGPEGGDADIQLKFGGGSGLNLLGDSGGSTMGSPANPGASPRASSDVNLSGPSGLNLLGSDVRLAPSEVGGKGTPDSSNVLTGGSSSGSGGGGGKTMLTAELADRAPPDSSVKLTLRDSESIFGDQGSDLTHNIHESGVNLLGSGDSGMALDDLRMAASSGPGKKRKGMGSDLEMKGEDDFLLTPLEEQADDSTDSGSQVIALEGEFGDDATATLMAGDVPGLGDMLQDSGGGLSPTGGMPMGAANVQYVTTPEPSYGVFAVSFLTLSSIVMGLVGMMMYDIVRNMWSWDTPYSFNSSLMDFILNLAG